MTKQQHFNYMVRGQILALKTITLGVLSLLALAGGAGLRAADAVRLPIASTIASADDGNVPANSLDGNLATRWSAQGDGQWIQFDLGATQTVGAVKIAWYSGD